MNCKLSHQSFQMAQDYLVLGSSGGIPPPHCSFKNVFPVNCISIFFPQAYANTSMMFTVSLHSIDLACTSLSTYMYMRVPCPYTHTCIYVQCAHYCAHFTLAILTITLLEVVAVLLSTYFKGVSSTEICNLTSISSQPFVHFGPLL